MSELISHGLDSSSVPRVAADAADTKINDVGVIVLAGGFGTRLRGVLADLPKPLAPVAGRPFVEWVVRHFADYGLREFWVSTGYMADRIEAHFAVQPVEGVRVTCVPETTPLGTAGGARNVLPEAGGTVRRWLVVNGDSLVSADPRPVVAALESNGVDAALLGLHLEDAGRYGTLDFDAEGRLTAFREKQPGTGIINAGVYGFTDAALRGLPRGESLSFEHHVFPQLAQQGRARVCPTRAPFLDIGTPESLATAEAFITEHQLHPIAA